MTVRGEHVFHVPDLMCGACVAAVSRALKGIDPRAHVEVDLVARRVRVVSTRLESLLQTLRRSGFPAEPVLQPLG